MIDSDATLKEAELIMAARSGDEDAFKELYEAHVEHVRRAGKAILRTDDLDDLTQDVTLLAWQGLAGFRGDSTFRTWITSITRNRCFALIEESRRRGAVFDAWSEQDELKATTTKRSQGRMEDRLDLSRLLGGLSDQSKELLEMDLEGLSDHEIADAKSLTVRAVRGLMQRGKDSMRKKICRVPEQSASPGSLMINKAISRSGGSPIMAVKGKRTRKRLKAPDVIGGEQSPVIPLDAQATTASDQGAAARDEASVPFSMNDLIAEVAQLEYLAAIEARKQFEAEIMREADILLRDYIQKMLIERGLDLLQEQAVFSRTVNKIGAFPEARENFARLQRLPAGAHSREARLWYCECLGQCVIPEAIGEVLSEMKTTVQGGQSA